jgi:hypothetical protein
MDQEVAWMAIYALGGLVVGLGAAGLLGLYIRRRKAAPDALADYWSGLNQ